MFSNKGLTSSEANHITNIVKELVKNIDQKSFVLYTSKIKNGGGTMPLDEFKRNEDWVDNVKKVGLLFSLSAFLKTAVKLKESKMDEERNKKFVHNVPYPTLKETSQRLDTSFETYLQTLNIKDLNEYLTNESIASHIGKFVHNFDEVRDASVNFQPTSFRQINNEVVTIINERLYTHEELLSGFFDLQKSHREAEKVVNYYKAKHKDWVKEIETKYLSDVQEVNFYNNSLINSYNSSVENARIEFEKEKQAKIQEFSKLKIEIPNNLQETLDYVNTFAR